MCAGEKVTVVPDGEIWVKVIVQSSAQFACCVLCCLMHSVCVCVCVCVWAWANVITLAQGIKFHHVWSTHEFIPSWISDTYFYYQFLLFFVTFLAVSLSLHCLRLCCQVSVAVSVRIKSNLKPVNPTAEPQFAKRPHLSHSEAPHTYTLPFSSLFLACEAQTITNTSIFIQPPTTLPFSLPGKVLGMKKSNMIKTMIAASNSFSTHTLN